MSKNAGRPLKAQIGWIDTDVKKDAIELAKGSAHKYLDAPEISFYAVMPLLGGHLWEIQEAGSGLSYLPAVAEALAKNVEPAWFRFGSKAHTFALRDGHPYCTILSNADSKKLIDSDFPELRPKGRMEVVVRKGRKMFAVGASFFVTGFLFLLTSVGAYVGMEQMLPEARVIDVEALPHHQWTRVEHIPRSLFVESLKYSGTQWATSTRSIIRVASDSQPGPGESAPRPYPASSPPQSPSGSIVPAVQSGSVMARPAVPTPPPPPSMPPPTPAAQGVGIPVGPSPAPGHPSVPGELLQPVGAHVVSPSVPAPLTSASQPSPSMPRPVLPQGVQTQGPVPVSVPSPIVYRPVPVPSPVPAHGPGTPAEAAPTANTPPSTSAPPAPATSSSAPMHPTLAPIVQAPRPVITVPGVTGAPQPVSGGPVPVVPPRTSSAPGGAFVPSPSPVSGAVVSVPPNPFPVSLGAPQAPAGKPNG